MQKNNIREHYLELYAVNDVHGCFFNTQHFPGAGCTSIANASTYINGRRSLLGPDNILLFDCGDNLQGDMSVCWSNRQVRESGAGHIYSKVARYLGIDAVVPGNHDFEAGPQVFGLVEDELAEAGITVLGANVLQSGTDRCRFIPYRILERGNLRVAVIGIANPSTTTWIPKDLREGMEFVSPLKAVSPLVDEIRSGNLADIVVLLIHSGFGEQDFNLEQDAAAEHQALALARELQGVDVIFAGHDHRQGCCRVGDTLLLSAQSHSNGLQRAVICVEKSGGKVVGKKIEGEIVQLEKVGADTCYLEHFGEEIDAVKRYTDEIVGVMPVTADAAKALCGPCSYVELIHSAQLWASGAQVSFASPYMYDIVIEAGPVSRKEIFMMYSAENSLFKIWMSGRQIKDYLEFSYSRWIGGGEGHILQLCSTELEGKCYWWPKNFTYNFDSAAGLIYTVDVTRACGDRVEILSLWNGEPFDMDGRYTVALSSYRVSGGGGIVDLGAGIDVANELDGITIARYPFIRDLLETYLHNGGDVMRDRCGKWKFVPEETARKGMENDMRLLFET